MPKRRAVIGLAILAIGVVVSVWWWRRGSAHAPGATTDPTTSVPGQPTVAPEINDVEVKRMGRDGAESVIEDSPIDTPLKLTIERNDKPLTVQVTLEPAP